MNRPIKFNAWDNEDKVMLTLPRLELLANSDGSIELQDVDKRFTYLQFTGLTDKNGKEIYEGDIVKRGQIVKVVEWIGCGFNIKAGLKNSWNKEPEVIGNIYENPELLRTP